MPTIAYSRSMRSSNSSVFHKGACAAPTMLCFYAAKNRPVALEAESSPIEASEGIVAVPRHR